MHNKVSKGGTKTCHPIHRLIIAGKTRSTTELTARVLTVLPDCTRKFG
jgi:hypothetical protein